MKHNIVQIYTLALSKSSHLLDAYFDLLNDQEKEKAARFIKPTDSYNYKVHKIFEKLVLAKHLQCPPREIILKTDQLGKPLSPRGLFYSKSHSGNFVVIALATFNIGIDIELTTTDENTQIMSDVLHPEESFKEDQFFTIWSCKEAYLKFLGTGLSKSMNEVKLESLPGGTYTCDSRGALRDLKIDVGYACYLCSPCELEINVELLGHFDSLNSIQNL